ncbi:MAG: biotin/lipoyl-containing protein, partial [Agrococcus casei]
REVKLSETELTGEQRTRLAEPGRDRQDALNELLFPAPTKDYASTIAQYGDLSVVDTIDYLYGIKQGEEHSVGIGKGVLLRVGLEAMGKPDEQGMVTVMTVLNGQLRPVYVRDRSVTVVEETAERADAANPNHIAAPFAGAVTVQVEEGAEVEVGGTVATIEAMKMEAGITSQVAGAVTRLAFTGTRQVEAGDLIAVITGGDKQ